MNNSVKEMDFVSLKNNFDAVCDDVNGKGETVALTLKNGRKVFIMTRFPTLSSKAYRLIRLRDKKRVNKKIERTAQFFYYYQSFAVPFCLTLKPALR